MEPVVPPIHQDSFGFALLQNEAESQALFPTPAPDVLATGFFAGSERTAVFIQAGRRYQAAAVDFVNRLAAYTVIAGHKPYAFRMILQGNWNRRTTERFLGAISTAAKKSRIAHVIPHIVDETSLNPTASAIVWAEHGTGAPVSPIEQGDLIICAADVQAVRLNSFEPKDLKAFPNWGTIVMRLWTEKYPRKQKVVRLVTCLWEVSAQGVQEATDSYRQGCDLALDLSMLKKMRGKAGVIVVCAPHFAEGARRRLAHLNRRAEVAVVGEFTMDERGEE